MTDFASPTRASLVRYALLPGIVPRIRNLLGGGFDYLAYFIAVVFNTLRIIPNGHPYLKSYNHGKFSVVHVLAVAANNISFDRKNLDKVTIFFVVIGGLVLMALQFLLCIMALFTTRAMAAEGPPGPQNFNDFFGNDHAGTDLAFRLLDLVFGVPDIFKSQDMGTTAFHTALHALFQFYSFGILLVGTFVIIYLTIHVVLETAQTGTPFGERFNSAWAPVRLILFFGLLLPAAYGLNLAQYLVLTSAKLGSNLATNGWLTFDNAVGETPYLGPPEELIARPNPPDLGSFVSFMQLAKTCSWAEGKINGRDIKPYIVFGEAGAETVVNDTKGQEESQRNSFEIGADNLPALTSYASRVGLGTLFIRFGVYDEEKYPRENGAVFPFCGELGLRIIDQTQPGATVMQQAYFDLISCMWYGNKLGDDAQDNLQSSLCMATMGETRGKNYAARYSVVQPKNPFPDMKYTEANFSKIAETRMASMYMDATLDTARDKQVAEGEWINDAALELGWAGAGIWFNKIAEQNGALTAAVYSTPEIRRMPYVMELIKAQKIQENASTPLSDLYTPSLATQKTIAFDEPQQREVLLIINQLFAYWGSEATTTFYRSIPQSQQGSMTGNSIIDTINLVMGTTGLFDMCRNTDVHPLAQMTSLGKGLVDHSIRSFVMAAGFGLGGGLAAMLEKQGFAKVFAASSEFFLSFAGIGLVMGIVLFYVIPFLPFIYFFFAVMTWIKSIFEAMVAMPLWALAHLHIDGEGMPGEAARAGYFHLLEIFLRPLCILISFLAGIAIFAAMVKVMNQIFYLLVSNLTGHQVGEDTGCFLPPGLEKTADTPAEEDYLGGTIDEFFYTVIYTIIVYLFAQPCFKMVDMIPDNIMRWLGAGIQSFGAQDGDPASEVMDFVKKGSVAIGGSLRGGFNTALGLFMK